MTTSANTTYVSTTCDCDCDCNSSSSNSGTSSGSNSSGSSSGSGSSTDGSGTNSSGTTTTTPGIPSTLSEFTDADTARLNSTDWTSVNLEITDIEKLITAAIAAGKFQIFVTGTYMTSPSTGLPYFRVHFNEDEWLNTTYDQMNIHYQIREVKLNFTNLGYDFEIVQNDNIPNTLMFIITW